MKIIYSIFSLTAFLVRPVSALIINIPADYPTIQQGIDAAAVGDTVLVAPGEYVENPIIEDKNVFLTSAQGPDGSTIKGAVYILGASVDTTCVLRGFRITKNVDDPFYDRRSLVQCEYSAPLIVGNIIEDNETWKAGAGINCFYYASPTIRANLIRNNFDHYQAGGVLGQPGVIIERNIISGNRAGFSNCERGDAGGILAAAEVIRYNLIINNETVKWLCETAGGGILRQSFPGARIYNNTIVNNSARRGSSHSNGGGIAFGVSIGDDAVIRNNIIAFNPYGGGVSASIVDSAWTGWDYNLVFGNDSANYIGIDPGPHDIQADPLLVDRFSGDYSLMPNSPCIDAGDPDFPLDPDGTRADIGAYYFDQTVGINDDGKPTGPYLFQLRQNYPNPFNSETIISYYLPESAVVSLHIFSIAGHFVKTLANKESQEAGEHQYTWGGIDKNGKEVSTGIYFYELYVNHFRQSKPMILIK